MLPRYKFSPFKNKTKFEFTNRVSPVKIQTFSITENNKFEMQMDSHLSKTGDCF